MKKSIYRIFSLLLSVVFLCSLLTACGGSKSSSGTAAGSTPAQTSGSLPSGDTANNGKVYELSLTMHDPATSGKTAFITSWAEEIKEATNGQIVITVYPGAVLAAATAALDAVVTGVCDMAWLYTGFFTNQFKLTDVFTLPLLGVKTSVQTTNVLWDLYNAFPELREELSFQKICLGYTMPPNVIGTRSVKVESLDTLKGLKIRTSSGPIADIINLWGASSILMGPGEVYESMEKGVIDGFTQDWNGFCSFKIPEVTKYYLDMDIFTGVFYVMMNNDSWNSIPANLQEVMEKYFGREYSIKAAEAFDADATKDKEETLAAGQGEMVSLLPGEYDKFKEIADEYNAGWVEKISSDGFDAQAYFDKTLELLEKYA